MPDLSTSENSSKAQTGSEVSAPIRIPIKGPLTVYTAEGIRDTILGQIHSKEGLIVDLAEVDSCDCAGLQLLCATHKSGCMNGQSIRLVNLSKPIIKAADELGLDLREYSDFQFQL